MLTGQTLDIDLVSIVVIVNDVNLVISVTTSASDRQVLTVEEVFTVSDIRNVEVFNVNFPFYLDTVLYYLLKTSKLVYTSPQSCQFETGHSS